MKHTLLIAALLSGATPVAALADAPDLAIALSPLREGNDGPITRLDVAIRFEAPAQGGDLAQMALRANTVETSAGDFSGLAFSDAAGFLPVEANDGDLDADNAQRRWRALRTVQGPVTLAYSVAIDPERPELALPQYELRAGEGGLSGAGNAFLVLPADDTARDVSIHWNLDGAGPDARGISSFGIGDVTSAKPLNPRQVGGSYYMTGRVGLFEKDTFFGAWQGRFGFEGAELMDWASHLQSFYGTFFDQRPASFGVFARTNRLNPGSGIGLTDSFAFTFDDETPIGEFKSLLAHEMVHAWINSLNQSMDEPGGLSLSWFGEGLAVHYQRLLPWRAGLMSSDAFLADLNSTAARYYTNAKIAVPNEEVPGGFWKDTRIRVLPYDRGSLYFASLDAQIRAASHGVRSLDDIVREMLATRRAGGLMDLPLFKKLLKEQLGEDGITGLDAMLSGETVIVPPDAFGACFHRVTKPLRRFDLGFDPEILVSPERIVTGLKPGSQAEKAGLRNGDRILNRFPQDAMQADQNAELTLEIERDAEQMSLTYLPRGETVDAYQWEAVEGAQDCN